MRIFTALIFFCISLTAAGQDIPMFSQKLTNSFIYNPALAGVGKGSFTYSYRNNYSGVMGAPKNNFVSLHSPFANYRFGIGANLFQEEVAAIKSTYMSLALAYHINFDKYSALSFGLSGEYNMLRLSNDVINQNSDGSDVVLARYGKGINTPDFSFGMSFTNRFLKMGVSANRLKSAWLEADSTKNLANYYSAFVHGIIPISGGNSTIEPYFAYRKFSETNSGFNVGLYYTHNKKITAGVAMRSGSILNATLGYNITKAIMVGYSREMILGSVGGYTGASNEFVLRLDFADRGAKQQFRSDYKSSLSYRKKSVTSSRNRVGGRNPKQLHKSQKRVAAYSPNSRYQNMSKLSAGKKTPYKKPSYNKSRKKPAYKKPNSAKRKSPTKRRR
jgi:type IX secretion system PorP/SprF family membrane protein